MLPPEQWLEIDRYALAMTRQMQAQCEADYGKYEFHRVVQALQTFCSEDLGGFYLDILKDRLYTTAANSSARRSAQSALWHITQTFVKLMAPILSFTAEEVWQTLSGDAEESVMLETWQPLPAPRRRSELLDKWSKIRGYRAEVTARSKNCASPARSARRCRRSLLLHADGENTNCSPRSATTCASSSSARRPRLVRSAKTSSNAPPLTHAKCERCWHVREDVGADAEHPEICGRCVSNLHGEGETRACA
jgi:isoleucyl-tRNA synthetase